MKGTQDLDHAPIQYDFHSHSNKEHYLERVGSQELLLRTLSCSMKEKRLLRQLRASTEKDVPKLVALKQSLYRAEKKLQEGIWNLVRIWRLWKVPLDKIGGNFGPGIQSYFSFLRFLLFINFLAVLLTTTFILLPVTMYNNVTIFLEAWSTEPQCVNHTIANSFRSPWQRFQDIFTGEGSLEHSYLFYGAYRVKQDSNHHYNVPLAYLLSMLGFLFACLIWILQRIVARLVQWQMQQWEFKPSFSARIFTEWDFCIQNPETANLKQKNIYNDLKIDLAEQIRLLQNEQRTRKQLAQQYLLRMLINIVILSLMAVAFYCIHKATDFSQEQNRKDAASFGVFSEYLPPVVISTVNVFLPFVFHCLARLEGYAPNTEVNLTLVRCVTLKLASLGMFLFFLGHRFLCIGNRSAFQCQQCGYNKAYQCWETHIGQEMYKITLFSFLTTLVSAFLISLPRRLMAKHLSCALAQWLGKEEFLVPHNVLDIVAAQTAIWIGIFFCPLVSLLGCIIIFFTFYIKKYTLFHNCQSSVQLFRASRSKFLFQIMLLPGLFLACIPLGYIISSASPSKGCGPFSKYSVPWQVVPEAVSHFPISVQPALNFATSSVFCLSLMMVLSLILTAYISQAQANKKVIASLKRQHAQCIQEKWNLVRKLDRLLVELPQI